MNVRVILLSFLLLAGVSAPGALAQQPQSPPKRCEAITKHGTRCKLNAVNNTKYCQVHQALSPDVPQCKAKTKSGTRCSRAARTAGYCTQHYQMYHEGKH